MGLFRKESKTKFVRDEEGKVIKVIRTGDQPRAPVSDTLLKQQPKMEKKPSRLIAVGKKIDKAIVKYNRERNPMMARKGKYTTKDNFNPFGNLFDTGMDYKQPKKHKGSVQKFYVHKGKAYPIVRTGKQRKKKSKSKKKRSSGNDMFDMFSDPFDTWRF